MKVIILRNHGLVAMGGSIEEAFHITHKLVKACEIQVRLHTHMISENLSVLELFRLL